MIVTADDVAKLLASSPPRQVPAHLSKAATAGGVLWLLPVAGIFSGSIGLLFVLIFFPWHFRDDWQLASDSARLARGVVTNAQETSMSINKTRVIEYDFSFTAEDGRNRQGHCFTTGNRWPASANVTIRYLSAKPEVACIEGARLSEGGWAGAFVILFPLVGIGLVVAYIVIRKRQRRLLHEGLIAEVDIISVTETNVRVNNRRVYKILISSPTFHPNPTVTVKRSNPKDLALAAKCLADKKSTSVIYAPDHPEHLLFPEALIDRGN